MLMTMNQRDYCNATSAQSDHDHTNHTNAIQIIDKTPKPQMTELAGLIHSSSQTAKNSDSKSTEHQDSEMLGDFEKSSSESNMDEIQNDPVIKASSPTFDQELKVELPEVCVKESCTSIGSPLAASSPSFCQSGCSTSPIRDTEQNLSYPSAPSGPERENVSTDFDCSATSWSMTSLEAIESCFQQKVTSQSSPLYDIGVSLTGKSHCPPTSLLLPAEVSFYHPPTTGVASAISESSNYNGDSVSKSIAISAESNTSSSSSTALAPSSVTPSGSQPSSCSPTTTTTSEDTDSGVGCSNDEMVTDSVEEGKPLEGDHEESCKVATGKHNVDRNFRPMRKRSIQFGNVTVYYFSRAQGFTCVPAQGGTTLGMSPQHEAVEKYSFTDYKKVRNTRKRQLLRDRKAKFVKKLHYVPTAPASLNEAEQPFGTDESDLATTNSTEDPISSSDTMLAVTSTPTSEGSLFENLEAAEVVSPDSENELVPQNSEVQNTEVDTEEVVLDTQQSQAVENVSEVDNMTSEEIDDSFCLEVVPLKKRRKLLKESGIEQIDVSEHKECEWIRVSREDCGCNCRIVCDPRTCLCSLNGIKCQVDRQSYPCGCTKQGCGNQSGRIEFNLYRVRTHFFYTLLRLQQHKHRQGVTQKPILSSNDTSNSNASDSDDDEDSDTFRRSQVDDYLDDSEDKHDSSGVIGERGECSNYCCLGVASRTTTYPDESHTNMMQQYYCANGLSFVSNGAHSASSHQNPHGHCMLPNTSALSSNPYGNGYDQTQHHLMSMTQNSLNQTPRSFINMPMVAEEDVSEEKTCGTVLELDRKESSGNLGNESKQQGITDGNEINDGDSDYIVETEDDNFDVNVIDSPEQVSQKSTSLFSSFSSSSFSFPMLETGSSGTVSGFGSFSVSETDGNSSPSSASYASGGCGRSTGSFHSCNLTSMQSFNAIESDADFAPSNAIHGYLPIGHPPSSNHNAPFTASDNKSTSETSGSGDASSSNFASMNSNLVYSAQQFHTHPGASLSSFHQYHQNSPCFTPQETVSEHSEGHSNHWFANLNSHDSSAYATVVQSSDSLTYNNVNWNVKHAETSEVFKESVNGSNYEGQTDCGTGEDDFSPAVKIDKLVGISANEGDPEN